MGGLLILIGLVGRDPAVGRPHQPLCLVRARHHRGLRRDRPVGRLPQGHQAQSPRACRARSSWCWRSSIAGRRAPGSSPRARRRSSALHAGAAVPQGRAGAARHGRLPRLLGPGDRRHLQRGEPDRRPRRAGDRSGDHGRRRVRADRLYGRQRRLHQLPLRPPRAARRASSRCCWRRWSGRGWASCGSTRRRPWSSWATPARCRSAARWAASRSSPSTRSCSRSSAACSCSRPSR